MGLRQKGEEKTLEKPYPREKLRKGETEK